MTKRKQQAWFVRVRGSYLPKTWQGWVTYIPYICYLVFAMFVLARTFGPEEWLLAIVLYVPVAVGAAVVMHWVARNKS